MLRRLAERGMQGVGGGPLAVVLVEQYYDFAAELADRYLVMERGEVVMSGRGKEMEADGGGSGWRSEAAARSLLRIRCRALVRRLAAIG